MLSERFRQVFFVSSVPFRRRCYENVGRNQNDKQNSSEIKRFKSVVCLEVKFKVSSNIYTCLERFVIGKLDRHKYVEVTTFPMARILLLPVCRGKLEFQKLIKLGG